LNIDGLLSIKTPIYFITSPIDKPTMWVKEGFETNLFSHTISIDDTDKHILNTPYFHKQLYSEFTNTQPAGKYVGSAYILLNSLPFKDLDDEINYVGTKGSGKLMSSLFREIGASHHIPYHMMLKWGSIYHRYKKYIEEV